jgi:hypothetical protein
MPQQQERGEGGAPAGFWRGLEVGRATETGNSRRKWAKTEANSIKTAKKWENHYFLP